MSLTRRTHQEKLAVVVVLVATAAAVAVVVVQYRMSSVLKRTILPHL